MNRLLGRLLGAVGLLALALVVGAARADTVTYFHNDIAGTPLAATDEGGNLLWKESYRPYGERLLNQTGPGANRLWFTGKPQDPDTGLSYLGARYYNPQLGRFVGVDPKAVDPEDLHSFNRYAYGNNNPYKFVDPDGRSPLVVAYYLIAWMAGGAAISGGTNAAEQYVATGEVQWGGVGGVLDAAGDGAMLGLLGGGTALAARTGAAAGTASEITVAKSGLDITKAYKRPSGATTAEQRASVQGKPCVDCGDVTPKQVADHKNPLVKEYYETGTIDTARMRSVDAVQPQCPTCSAKQGAEMSRYSQQMKKELGLD